MDQNLISLMNHRRSETEMSYDKLARQIGIDTTMLYRFFNGQKGLGVRSLRIVAAWAARENDDEILQALADYALGENIVSLNKVSN